MNVRLTDAQVSALECAGLALDDDPAAIALLRAWRDGDWRRLSFEPGDRDLLTRALVDAANSEDAAAERGDPFAARARASLEAVARKVARA